MINANYNVSPKKNFFSTGSQSDLPSGLSPEARKIFQDTYDQIKRIERKREIHLETPLVRGTALAVALLAIELCAGCALSSVNIAKTICVSYGVSFSLASAGECHITGQSEFQKLASVVSIVAFGALILMSLP